MRINRKNITNNKEKKKWLEQHGKIRCGYCGYHRGENATFDEDKSWKRKRKLKWKRIKEI